jgi:hypothetical protein
VDSSLKYREVLDKPPVVAELFNVNHPYYIVDIGRIPEEKLSKDTVAGLFALYERCKNPDTFRELNRALIRLLSSPENKKLLNNFISWINHLLSDRFDRTVIIPTNASNEEALEMLQEEITNWENEKFMAGLQKGYIKILMNQLAKKFGQDSVDATVKERLQNASEEEILTWSDRFVFAKTLNEVFDD